MCCPEVAGGSRIVRKAGPRVPLASPATAGPTWLEPGRHGVYPSFPKPGPPGAAPRLTAGNPPLGLGFPICRGGLGRPTWLYHAECILEAKLAQALPGEKEGALHGVALFFKPPAQDTLVENTTGRAGGAAAGGRLGADPL